MKTFALVAVLAVFAAGVVYAAGNTVTVSQPGMLPDAGQILGVACTPVLGGTGSLGLIKNYQLQCDNAKVYVRRCGPGSLCDAGYGDTQYDFTKLANDHLPPPAAIRLRTSETRVCIRNTAQPADGGTADAGDFFTCWLNENEPS